MTDVWGVTGDRRFLLTAAGVRFNAGVLPASGAWTASEMINVRDLRRIHLEALYDAHASTTTGYAEIILMLASAWDQPAAVTTAGAWANPAVTDGTVTAAALASGTIVGEATRTASWGKVVYRPMVIQVGAALANSDKIRAVIEVDVTGASWFALQTREAGDTTNRGTIDLAIIGAN